MVRQSQEIAEELICLQTKIRFRIEVEKAVRERAWGYYINPSAPEEVRIPSRERYQQECTKMAAKALQGEAQKGNSEKLTEQTYKSIESFVDKSLRRYPPLFEL